MKIIMENWKKFITEAEPPKDFAPGISEPTTQKRPPVPDHKRRPKKKTQSYGRLQFFEDMKQMHSPEFPKNNKAYVQMLARETQVVKKQMIKNYTHRANIETYVRLVKDIPNVTASRKEILSKYDIMKKEIARLISMAPVKVIWEGRYPEETYEQLRPMWAPPGDVSTKQQLLAVAATMKDYIVFNPYNYLTLFRTVPPQTLKETLYEEIRHYVQINFEGRSMFAMSYAGAHRLPILLPRSETKLSKGWYEYVAKDWLEFDAKIARIKSLIMNQTPEAFDKKSGRIDRKVLLNFIKNRTNQDRFPILLMLDTSKIEKIGEFFDKYVIAKAPASLQQKRHQKA